MRSEYAETRQKLLEMAQESAAFRAAARTQGLPKSEADRLTEAADRICLEIFDNVTPHMLMATVEILFSAIGGNADREDEKRAAHLAYAMRSGYAAMMNRQ